MKTGLTLKHMILATLLCIVITVVDILIHKTSGVSWISPREFKTYFYWIILLIGWVVYFLEHFRSHKKEKEQEDSNG